jgi:hypothetical protein
MNGRCSFANKETVETVSTCFAAADTGLKPGATERILA